MGSNAARLAKAGAFERPARTPARLSTTALEDRVVELEAQLTRADLVNDELLDDRRELTAANTQATAACARLKVENDALRAQLAALTPKGAK